jgi:hypothetical protein
VRASKSSAADIAAASRAGGQAIERPIAEQYPAGNDQPPDALRAPARWPRRAARACQPLASSKGRHHHAVAVHRCGDQQRRHRDKVHERSGWSGHGQSRTAPAAQRRGPQGSTPTHVHLGRSSSQAAPMLAHHPPSAQLAQAPQIERVQPGKAHRHRSLRPAYCRPGGRRARFQAMRGYPLLIGAQIRPFIFS